MADTEKAVSVTSSSNSEYLGERVLLLGTSTLQVPGGQRVVKQGGEHGQPTAHRAQILPCGHLGGPGDVDGAPSLSGNRNS